MTARHPMNVGETDLLLSNQSFSLDSSTSQSLEVEHNSSEMSEALTTLMGGLSGLGFTLSLIFFLQAPIISVVVLIALASGWGGTAWYKAREASHS